MMISVLIALSTVYDVLSLGGQATHTSGVETTRAALGIPASTSGNTPPALLHHEVNNSRLVAAAGAFRQPQQKPLDIISESITVHFPTTDLYTLAHGKFSKAFYERGNLTVENKDLELPDKISSKAKNWLNYLQYTQKQVHIRNRVVVTESSSQEKRIAGISRTKLVESRLKALHKNEKPQNFVKPSVTGRSSDVKMFVDGSRVSGPLPHFWRSTGLCPPSPHSDPLPFLLSLDEKLNLALVGSLPHNAISHVRIHWLLDLVQGSLENGVPRYDFSQLDELMDHLRQYHLQPGFELMGNPSNIFSDFENVTQVLWWKNLVAETAKRYVGRYGLRWVSRWRWESWNEPDHHDFDGLNFTIQGFLNYYDACRAGLDEVESTLVLGGPGGSCRAPSYSRMCWALLQHCHNGSSFFTPGRPPRIDFISIHKKGEQDADSILVKEMIVATMIRKNYPSLSHLPLVNDEGDFMKGWWRGLAWRADCRYAALVCRAVYTHLEALPRLHYQLISFDNAFLNYRPSFFNQRTLMARFQINSTTPRQVQLVKKASYDVMAVLSLLGDHTLAYTLHHHDPRLSVITSCRNCLPERIETSTRNNSTYLHNTHFSVYHSLTSSETQVNNPHESNSPFHDDQTERHNVNNIHLRRPFDMHLGGAESRLGGVLTGSLNDHNTERKRPSTIFPRLELEPENIGQKTTDDEVNRLNETQDTTVSSESVRQDNVKEATKSGRLIRFTQNGERQRRMGKGSSAWESTLLLSLSNGTEKTKSSGLRVRVSLALPKFLLEEELMMVTYQLGSRHRGSYDAWVDLGRPLEPTRAQLAYIRSYEGPKRTGPTKIVTLQPSLNIDVKLSLPDVRVIHLCQVSTVIPGQVVGVKTVGVTSSDVLVTWSDARVNTRCVLKYEVEVSEGGRGGPYTRVSSRHHPAIDNNFWYALPTLHGPRSVQGWYRVRVVTYWGTAGPFSSPVYHHLG